MFLCILFCLGKLRFSCLLFSFMKLFLINLIFSEGTITECLCHRRAKLLSLSSEITGVEYIA